MTYTYNLTESTGKIRLLIPDRIEAEAIFTDEELASFYELEGSSVKGATALALETIAVDEALVQKVMRTENISTDGAALARVLLSRATQLRSQQSSEGDETTWDWAEIITGPFGARERIYNEVLRGY